MKLIAYLSFNGNCKSAFEFYERCLGGKITDMIRYEGTPAAEFVPAEARSRIMHACLKVGEATLMGGDGPPESQETQHGFCVSIHVPEPDEVDRVFTALADGGTVTMPLEQTFWSVRFGMLTDKFGIPWIINCEKAPA
jgi:PhnB protein